MRERVVDRGIKIIILTCFIVLPCVGWLIWRPFGAILGLILAILIDLFSPKWVFELSWSDISLALKNQYLYGCNGSLLCFRIGLRKLYIYRDEKGKGIRIGLRIPLYSWEDIFSRNELEGMTTKFGGWSVFDKWKNKECFVYFPKGGVDGCNKVLRYFIDKSIGGIIPNIYGRIDCAKKDIWRYKE